MKHSRELKVGILAIVAIFVLYFGFNFLKGVNIFSPTKAYFGQYDKLNGLVEQSPVYICGYKVGQVDKIVYDFTTETPFLVAFSVNKDIVLPQGTRVALIADGLLGGSALELYVPIAQTDEAYSNGDTIPSLIVPGLVDNLQNGLLQELEEAVKKIDSLLTHVDDQLEGDHIKSSLANVEQITDELKISASSLNVLLETKIPSIAESADSLINDVKVVVANLSDIDFANISSQIDTTLTEVNEFMQAINSKDGTIGLLINDTDLYVNLNQTVNSVDSLLTDIKQNPKRYVHFSLFDKTEKKDKNKK